MAVENNPRGAGRVEHRHVVQTPALPPNQGRICHAMIGWTMNSRKPPEKMVAAYRARDGEVMRGVQMMA